MTDLPITDEMPDTWVRALTDAIEAYDHTVTDAHETAITIALTPRAMQPLGADPGEELYIGWSERAGIDWGLGHAGHVPDPQPLGADTITETAARVHLLLTTGRPA
ncbi:hypothetical protein [Streptomyces sp. NPDC126499]|uniref:hypothetical protein n=1 Tax=Streptomyces sp. NPDC126499 TaxID=3155314 RepID=UPI00331EFC2C